MLSIAYAFFWHTNDRSFAVCGCQSNLRITDCGPDRSPVRTPVVTTRKHAAGQSALRVVEISAGEVRERQSQRVRESESRRVGESESRRVGESESRRDSARVGITHLVSKTEPFLSSATWHSVQPPRAPLVWLGGPGAIPCAPASGRSAPPVHVCPWSSEYTTNDAGWSSQPQSCRSAARSRPLCGPPFSAIPDASPPPKVLRQRAAHFG